MSYVQEPGASGIEESCEEGANGLSKAVTEVKPRSVVTSDVEVRNVVCHRSRPTDAGRRLSRGEKNAVRVPRHSSKTAAGESVNEVLRGGTEVSTA